MAHNAPKRYSIVHSPVPGEVVLRCTIPRRTTGTPSLGVLRQTWWPAVLVRHDQSATLLMDRRYPSSSRFGTQNETVTCMKVSRQGA